MALSLCLHPTIETQSIGHPAMNTQTWADQ
jgi:hypothetical protein